MKTFLKKHSKLTIIAFSIAFIAVATSGIAFLAPSADPTDSSLAAAAPIIRILYDNGYNAEFTASADATGSIFGRVAYISDTISTMM